MPDERPEVPSGHLSSSEGPPEPRGQRGAARAWWHTTSQRRGNFGATRTTPTPSAPSTSASSSTSSAAGRPLTSHTSAFSRFSAGRRALSRFSKQQGPGSLRSFPGGRRHPMGWRRLLPARWGDGPHVLAQSVSKQGQSFQVAHCAERCDQRGLQARAPGRQTLLIVPKPNHSARLTLVANRPRAGGDPSGAAAAGRLVGNEKISGCGRQAGGGRAGRPAQEVPLR